MPPSGRFPEPRVLYQDRSFWMPDRTELRPADFAPVDARWLLSYLVEIVAGPHGAAVRDERLAMSTRLRGRWPRSAC